MTAEIPLEVDVAQARRWVRTGAILLDVRDRAERERQSIPDSLWIPFSELGQRWQELPRDRQVVVCCSAGSRSFRAAIFLRDRGVLAAALVGGLAEWRAQGAPVVEGDQEAAGAASGPA